MGRTLEQLLADEKPEVVADAQADAVQAHLEAAGETVYRIGRIAARADGEAQTTVG